eukprot:TRINITY_DN27628_c0_g1_i1.p1 TRINITY_DN27628_c0_g1~~TRINITY_DN27628_c0_g1_i1.p1  ORF type:complete len:845 (+),score=131.45 TRINITY_DN27628_c0_g1_i1:54-2588(+)
MLSRPWLLVLLPLLHFTSRAEAVWDGTLSISDERDIAKLVYSATIGNGLLGAIMDARTPSLYLSGVFNGRAASNMDKGAISHRAAVPNPLNTGPEAPISGNAGATLDFQRAVFVRRSRVPSQGTDWKCHRYGPGQGTTWCRNAGVQHGVEYRYVGPDLSLCNCWCCKRLVRAQPEVLLEQRFYAHRTRPSLLIMEYDAEWKDGPESVIVNFNNTFHSSLQFDDFTAVHTESTRSSLKDRTIFTWVGKTVGTEPGADPVTVACCTFAPGSVQIARGKWYASVAAYRTSLDSTRPQFDAHSDLMEALADLEDDQLTGDPSRGKVFSQHVSAWSDLWKSGVSVTGRPDVEQAIKSSTYYILSSVREDRPYSLSPGGLASNAYNGHTFWDTETWMYPPILAWYPELARSLLEYRVARLPAAEAKAASYTPPFEGAMFAWESAFTGAETCPPAFPFGRLEQHISADISFAVRQYFYTTLDVEWLKASGFQLLSKVAHFFVSKAVQSEHGHYYINHVIPPDEYAVHGIDDSIYTNWVAKLALEFASEAADIIDARKNPRWMEVAQDLVLLFDADKRAHPEYQGYKWGTKVKQADVVLLPYPLEMPMEQDVRLNDLRIYAEATDANGPAMTWSAFAIGYIMAGEGYEAKATENFNRAFSNVKKPFNVWSEYPVGGATNFITGAGGFLQAVTFGYFGLRITRDSMTLLPAMIQGTSFMENRGLKYLGRSFTISCYAEGKQILKLESGKPLSVSDAKGEEYLLEPETSLSFPLGTKLTLRSRAAATKKEQREQRLFEEASLREVVEQRSALHAFAVIAIAVSAAFALIVVTARAAAQRRDGLQLLTESSEGEA